MARREPASLHETVGSDDGSGSEEFGDADGPLARDAGGPAAPPWSPGRDSDPGHHLPLVVALSCLPDCDVERAALAGVAEVTSVGAGPAVLPALSAATVVILLSLHDVVLPAAQSLLRDAALVVCIGAGDPSTEAAAADDLGLDPSRLLHVAVSLEDEAADTVMALALGLLRRTHALASTCRRGVVSPTPGMLRGTRRCSGLTFGLLGCDAVAHAVARRASAFGFRILHYCPPEIAADDPPSLGGSSTALDPGTAAPPSPAVTPRGRRRRGPGQRCGTLGELLSLCDVLSLHVPLTDATAGLVSGSDLAGMKPDAVVINTASVGLVDEDALKVALLRGRLGGAALDAFDPSCWLESWAREMPTVLLTPRAAFYSDQAFSDQRLRAAAAVRAFLTTGVATVPESPSLECVRDSSPAPSYAASPGAEGGGGRPRFRRSNSVEVVSLRPEPRGGQGASGTKAAKGRESQRGLWETGQGSVGGSVGGAAVAAAAAAAAAAAVAAAGGGPGPQALFFRHHRRRWREEGGAEGHAMREDAAARWGAFSEDEKRPWEARAASKRAALTRRVAAAAAAAAGIEPEGSEGEDEGGDGGDPDDHGRVGDHEGEEGVDELTAALARVATF